jgi:hypothetical protein
MAAGHGCTITSGLASRASSMTASSKRFRSSIVNDQNSATPLVTQAADD